MQEQKQIKKKRYSTKKRRVERLKWQLLLSLTAVAASVIAVAYIGTITPVMAQRYDFKIGGWKEPESKEISVTETIWKIGIERGAKDEDIMKMIRIAYCESRYNEYAINVNRDGSFDLGVFQINEKWHPTITRDCLFNSECNINEAFSILNKSGFKAWACNKYVN